MPSSPRVLPNGIANIALSFSGGGYRAAAFTLGCVSYLHVTPYEGRPLLDRVRFISSASGGSITSLVLCSMLREGRSFEEVYKRLGEQMQGCRLVDAVFEILNDDGAWADRPDKRRNVINAFAMVYDRDLFKGRRFGILWEEPRGGFVVDELCVNTTEFNNGLNFRFGTEGVLGNKFLHFKPAKLDVAKQMRLGDILACSSCFTAGFEPVMFPGDFAWKSAEGGLSREELADAIDADNRFNSNEGGGQEVEEIGFMDGGIDDNQGIYAFILADGREKEYDYDLYMPCDVSSNYLKHPFRYPEMRQDPALRRSLRDWMREWRKFRRLFLGIVGGALIVAISLLYFPGVRFMGSLLLGMVLASFLLSALATVIVAGKLRDVLQSLIPVSAPDEPKTMVDLVFRKHLGIFLDMPLARLINLLEARGSSVVLLATTIFLKKIRRASYDLLFADKSLDVYRALTEANNGLEQPGKIDVGRLWRDHIAMTAVYQLSTKNDAQLRADLASEPWEEGTEVEPGGGELLEEFLMPSERLRAVVDIATEMGTTLWFDANDVAHKCFESLLAAGQATICFNLLRVCWRFGNADAEWVAMRKRLVEDWRRFKVEPYWLYNEYIGLAGLAGFERV